jgi:ABC-type nitrate/sulfonate/bicarbonate transport system substrate-binding protein
MKVAIPQEPAFATFALASAHGWFAEAGVDVEAVVVPPGLSGLDLLRRGEVDLIAGSLLFALTDLDVLCVGVLNSRCHHVVVARPDDDRDHSALGGRNGPPVVILVPGHAPTPVVALQEGLRRAGWSPATQLVPYPNSGVVAQHFIHHGHGDLALVPFDVAVEHGLPVVLSLAQALGPIPWSVLMTHRSRADLVDRSLRHMLDAIKRAAQALTDEVSGSTLVGLPPSARWLVLASPSLRKYAESGLWPTDCALDVVSTQRWADILARARVAPAVDVNALRWSPAGRNAR